MAIITAILIDDEQANLDNLSSLLAKHCVQVQVIGLAKNVEDGLALVREANPDLVFLDIQMGKTTGFDLLKAIPNKNFEVIFVTAFDHYGIQAVKFAAIDYLLKPINVEELKQAVTKVEARRLSNSQNQQLSFLLQNLQQPLPNMAKIALPQQSEIRYVLLSDIVRCEASNTYTFFYLQSDEKILVSKALKEYADLLKPKGFLRTHQSHLVNPKFVKSWLKEDGGMLLLYNGQKVPVSKPNRDLVKAALS